MKIRRLSALSLALALCLTLLGACGAKPAEEVPTVPMNVAISSEGTLVLPCVTVNVPDEDGNGTVTVEEALTAAHAANFKDGAAGFAMEDTEYGQSISKLWGVENGCYAYSYYVNTEYVLPDAELKTDDVIYAYSYSDLAGFSDTYSYFDTQKLTVSAPGKLSFTLFALGYDASYNPVSAPLAGAEITLNGEPTGIFSGENGSFEITLDAKGEYVLSATWAEGVLAPPVCAITVG